MPHDLARQIVAAYPDVWAAGMRHRLRPDLPWCRYEGSDATDDDGQPVVETVPTARSPFAEMDLDDDATAGVLLARLKSMGAFVALTYGTDVDGDPVNHLRVWTGDGRLRSTPLEFDGPTLGYACAAALVALTTPPTE